MRIPAKLTDESDVRIPAKLTDESDDVDREERRGAWWLNCIVGGHHRVGVNQFSEHSASIFRLSRVDAPQRGSQEGWQGFGWRLQVIG